MVSKRCLFCAVLGIVFVMQIHPAHALEDAQVLPKGVSRVRMVGVWAEPVHDKFDNNGQLESYARPLNISLNTVQLAAQNPSLKKLYNYLSSINAQDARNLMNVNTYTNSQVQLNEKLFAWEYGLNSKLSLGIRIPIITMTGNVQYQADVVNNANAIAKKYGNLPPTALAQGLRQAGAFNAAQFNAGLFTDRGYVIPSNYSYTALGDMEFGGKYQFYSSALMQSAVQAGFRAPTGRVASNVNLFDPGTGYGAWAIGAQEFNDVHITSNWTFGSMLKLGYDFPAYLDKVVPSSASDQLPDVYTNTRKTRFTRGPEVKTELSTSYWMFDKSIEVWSAYQFFHKLQDSYVGSDNLDYAALDAGTAETQHCVEVGAMYSSIQDFLEKKQKIPYQVIALYDHQVAGVNSPVTSYVRVDLIGYF